MERRAALQLRQSLRLAAAAPSVRASLSIRVGSPQARASDDGSLRSVLPQTWRQFCRLEGPSMASVVGRQLSSRSGSLAGPFGRAARLQNVRYASPAAGMTPLAGPGPGPSSPGAGEREGGGGGGGGGDKWQIKMLYDGDCPLCMREVNMLRGRNERYQAIKFVDIATDDYDPADNAGIDFETAMGRIHGIQRDGTVVTNVEAFRKFYEAVGLGWVYAITRFRPLGKVADVIYDMWARYRLPVTGRPPLATVMQDRQKRLETARGAGQRCRMDS